MQQIFTRLSLDLKNKNPDAFRKHVEDLKDLLIRIEGAATVKGRNKGALGKIWEWERKAEDPEEDCLFLGDILLEELQLELVDQIRAPCEDRKASFAEPREVWPDLKDRSLELKLISKDDAGDDDDYTSDFSDDDYVQEDLEEKVAYDAITKILEQVGDYRGSKYAMDTSKALLRLARNRLAHSSTCTLDIYSLKQILADADIDLNVLEYHAVALGLSFANIKTEQAFTELVENLKSRSRQWWRDRIRNRYFDVKYKRFNFGEFSSNNNQQLRNWTFDIIIYKILDFTKNFTSAADFAMQFARNSPFRITPRELRRAFLHHKIPLTRAETKIVIKLLGREQEDGTILVKDLIAFIQNPDLHGLVSSREAKRFPKPPSFLEDPVPKNGAQYLDELRETIKNQKIDKKRLFDTLRMRDVLCRGSLLLDDILSALKSLKLPLVTLKEVEEVSKIVSGGKPLTRIDINHFVTVLFDQIKDGNKENYPSQQQQCYVHGDKYSKENTMKLKVDHLEIENVDMKKTIEDMTKKVLMLEEENGTLKMYVEELQRNQANTSILNRSMDQDKFQELERRFIQKDIETSNLIREANQRYMNEIAILKKKHEEEQSRLRRSLEQKDNEVEEFRKQIQDLLNELEILQKTTYRTKRLL